MDRKRKYRILLIGIVGILCFAAVLLYTCQNRMKKELTEKLEAWLQGREGTFVIEQEVVSDTFSGRDICKIRYGNEEQEYECSVYEEESEKWIKKEQEAEFYEKALTEILQACMPKGYITKKENQYRDKYKKNGVWEVEYQINPKEMILEKIIVYGTGEQKGESVKSKTTIWHDKDNLTEAMASLSEGKEGIVLTVSEIEEEEKGYWVEYVVENKTDEPVSYAQDWKIECWQKNTWEQAAEADGWEDCLYSASARGMDKQRFLIPKDVEFFPDKIYRLVKKLYFLEEEEKDWMAGEIQFL